MTNQEILKNLAKIYLAVDKARSDLEDLLSDYTLFIKSEDWDFDLYNELEEIHDTADGFSNTIEAIAGVSDAIDTVCGELVA